MTPQFWGHIRRSHWRIPSGGGPFWLCFLGHQTTLSCLCFKWNIFGTTPPPLPRSFSYFKRIYVLLPRASDKWGRAFHEVQILSQCISENDEGGVASSRIFGASIRNRDEFPLVVCLCSGMSVSFKIKLVMSGNNSTLQGRVNEWAPPFCFYTREQTKGDTWKKLWVIEWEERAGNFNILR